ncbi:hypothetical protein AGMMS50268_15530 [Spirochaetia bacterium]|nr:hypothetical protein AGMMS50268_15530 [Spirochaetia bacterium]
MTKRFFQLCAIILISVAALGAGIVISRPSDSLYPRKNRERQQTRIVIPQELDAASREGDQNAERMAYEDSVSTKIALEEGEVMIAVLTQDFDGDPPEEQFIAYRNLLEIESPIYIAYIDYDEIGRVYRRIWNAPTAATRPGTVSLYTQDIIGDRSVCILVAGMNNPGEHTLTIFRRNDQTQTSRPRPSLSTSLEPPFSKIAELRIDGSIRVQEVERSQAYQVGIASGQSFSIAAYGHDYESENMLDQMEIIFTYNPGNGLYEQSKITRIPGSQIEQRRLRELLSGAPGVFERFINDLWYYVSPQGTLDSRQYIYFDPQNRELIFFGDNAQQVFSWQNSSHTRYGLYITAQNISVTTLRRFLDIELESLDSIRVKIFEDVHLKIGVNNSWDGSYRRAGTVEKPASPSNAGVDSFIDALYDGSIGKIRFSRDGVYELNSGGALKKGRYAFSKINDQEILELRADNTPGGPESPGGNSASLRETYRVDRSGSSGSAENLSLSRIRIGAMGIQDLHEGAIALTQAKE